MEPHPHTSTCANEGAGLTITFGSLWAGLLVLPSDPARPLPGWDFWFCDPRPLPSLTGSEATTPPRALVLAASSCAALLCALALGAACRRLALSRRLLPPIPGIRDRVSDDERVNSETLRKDLLRP